MFARSLMPGLGKMLVAAAPATAMRNQNALSRLVEIGESFGCFAIEDHRAHGNLQNHVGAGMARAIGAFAVASTIGLELTIVAISKQRVVVWICFEINAASVAAIAGLHKNLGFINEHGELFSIALL